MNNDEMKKPKKQASPFREWVSDYLRYIILIAAIIIIVLVVFFVVRGIRSGKESAESSAAESTAAEALVPETEEETESAAEAETSEATAKTAETAGTEEAAVKESTAEDAEAETAGAETKTAESQSAATDKAAEAAESAASETMTDGTETAGAGEPVSESTSVDALVRSFYEALASGDVEKARSCSEALDDETAFAIANGYTAESYSDIQTYVYEGDEEGSYVVFLTCSVKMRENKIAFPATAVHYVITKNGSPLIGSAETLAAHNAVVEAVQARPEISKLITETETAFAAMKDQLK